MAWTTPRTWSVDEIVTAAMLNGHVRDNLNFLLSGRAQAYTCYVPGSVYSTTSGSFADVDATNLALTLTITSTRLLAIVTFDGSASNNGSIGAFRLTDGTTALGDATKGQATIPANANRRLTLLGRWTGLTPGSVTIKLQFKTSDGAQTTYVGNIGDGNTGPIEMLAWEY